MLLHNLRIAWKSLRRSPSLTALVVAGIAIGIAVSTTFAAVRHAFAKDPIPSKSKVLHYVQLDSWDPQKAYPHPTNVPTQISFRDMTEITKSTIPVRQTPLVRASLPVFPEGKDARPTQESIRLCRTDFFPMLEIPFQYGGPWSAQDDAGPAQVVVLSQELNQTLFGGQNSVGKRVRIRDREFQISGVLAEWKPSLKFYDLTNNNLSAPESLYMPFGHFRAMQLNVAGNTDGWGPGGAPGFEGFLASETVFIQMWVELPDRNAVAAYHAFLDAYAAEQKKVGRFQRPIHNLVTPVMDLIDTWQIVPRPVSALYVVSILFLAVCAVNLIGLLLGKFLARAPEVSVRRALGASRMDIFLQHIVECQVVALVGGALGFVLSIASIGAINLWLKSQVGRGDLFQLDLAMVLFAVVASLVAGFSSGLYPAWRACRLSPAVHLRIQ